jgi:CheY-like chemotaxis protein
MIVKQLVDLLGGTVRARSEGEGRGATFVVELPLDSAAAGMSRRPERRRTNGAPSYESSKHLLAGLAVLVVEDEPDARELVERLLSEAGCSVTAVESAAQALRVVASDRPQLLISDIGLPDEDGYSLIKRIRRLDRTEGGAMPAIALTAFARTEDRARALLAGFQAHIGKPVDAGELLATVTSLADMVAADRRAADEAAARPS